MPIIESIFPVCLWCFVEVEQSTIAVAHITHLQSTFLCWLKFCQYSKFLKNITGILFFVCNVCLISHFFGSSVLLSAEAPDLAGRLEILKAFVPKDAGISEEALNEAAVTTAGLLPADIKSAVSEAFVSATARTIDLNKFIESANSTCKLLPSSLKLDTLAGGSMVTASRTIDYCQTDCGNMSWWRSLHSNLIFNQKEKMRSLFSLWSSGLRSIWRCA